MDATLLFFLIVSVSAVKSQVYSWAVSEPLQEVVCSGASVLNLDWTYTPTSSNPLLIDWVKLQADGISVDKSIATKTGSGAFTPGPGYGGGKVTKSGNTAEITIQNPTAADGGLYRVTVTDGGGFTTVGAANVTFTTPASLDASGVTSTCSGSVVTCRGVLNHGSPPAVLTTSYGSFSDSTSTGLTISTTVTSKETVICELTGAATQCFGGTPPHLNHSVLCGVARIIQ